MLLTIDQEVPPLRVHATTPTALAPGEAFTQTLSVYSSTTIWLHAIEFVTPDGVAVDEDSYSDIFPYHLHANDTVQFEVAFGTQVGNETFGTINGHVYFSQFHPEEATSQQARDEEQSIHWQNWVSVFQRAHAFYPQPLSNALRQRLMDVTNSHPRNPHIFLADFVRYFDDFLNIRIDEAAAASIAEELPFATQGVPLAPETRLLIAQGKMQFYGIEDFTLLAEEECDECDDVFQSSGTSDVDNGEVEVL